MTIKMKDEDGQVVEFEDDGPVAAAPTVVKKKKKTKPKAAKDSDQGVTQMIEAEDTLAMIKNALKSGNAEDSGKKVKKVKKKEKVPKAEEMTEETTEDKT